MEYRAFTIFGMSEDILLSLRKLLLQNEYDPTCLESVEKFIMEYDYMKDTIQELRKE